MPQPIQAVFTISRAEYIQAIRRHYRSLNNGQDLAFSFMAIVLGSFAVQSGIGQFLGWAVIGVCLLLFLKLIYAFLLIPVLMYRNQPKLQSEYRLAFHESGIHIQTDQIQSQLQLSFYHSWRLDDRFYYLYYGKRDLSIIPRRAFSAEADAQFSEMLRHQIGPPLK